MPRKRLLTNKLFSKITSDVCKQHVPDALCGYKIISRETLKSIRLQCDKFSIDSEIFIKAAKAGFKIDSINIRCIYGSESSHIRPLVDGYNFARLIVRELKDNQNA